MVCEGGGLCAGGRAGYGWRGRFVELSAVTRRKRWQLHHARLSGKCVAEMDPQRMFLEQLLGRAGAFRTEFWTSYFLFPRDHNFRASCFFGCFPLKTKKQ